jgi:hypothetical protein
MDPVTTTKPRRYLYQWSWKPRFPLALQETTLAWNRKWRGRVAVVGLELSALVLYNGHFGLLQTSHPNSTHMFSREIRREHLSWSAREARWAQKPVADLHQGLMIAATAVMAY